MSFKKEFLDDLLKNYKKPEDLMGKNGDYKYQSIGNSWKINWANITPFLDYPPDIRKAIHTTNAIESINRSLRKVVKNHTIFTNDTTALELTLHGSKKYF